MGERKLMLSLYIFPCILVFEQWLIMCFIFKMSLITTSLITVWVRCLQDKKSLNLGPEDNLYLEGFALNVFGKADKQDRAGRADLYDASIFFSLI
jgi:hypothetical protein